MRQIVRKAEPEEELHPEQDNGNRCDDPDLDYFDVHPDQPDHQHVEEEGEQVDPVRCLAEMLGCEDDHRVVVVVAEEILLELHKELRDFDDDLLK